MRVTCYLHLRQLSLTLFFVFFCFTAILAKNPYFLNKKGVENFYHGKYASSLKYFRDAYNTDKREEYKFNKGVSLYKLKKYDNSSSIFLSLSNKTDNGDLKEKAFYNLGIISYKKKRLKQALNFFKKALEINSKDREAKINYEMVLKQLQKKHKSRKPKKQQSENKKDKKNNPENNRKKNANKNKRNKNSKAREKKNKKKSTPDIDKGKKGLKNKNKIDKKILNLYSDDKKLIKKSIRKMIGVKRENPAKDW